ncbi:SGNH/GDSL hydrolase family protein [Paraburkholderia sp. J12]|uniref:SGNH/GDSL hydrolase family protein n=1 Tax=Paraburkholderia sp. J12 TaxID=2805432 RepID=UPI002ABDBA86|nr:GDSL-type esterase/lipase family protein [Paraburkholderia sp. J12]
MVRHALPAALLAVVLMAPAVANAQQPAQAAVEIVAFGASQTAGKGVAPEEAYPARLEALLKQDGFNVTVSNQGVSGDTVADEMERLDEALPPSTRLVLYQPGSNDCGKKHQSSESSFRDGIDSTLSWMQQHHFQVLTLDSNCHFGVLEDETKKFGFTYYGKMTQGVGDLRQADGQHLTPEGYQKLAQRLLPSVEQLLKAGDANAPAKQ